MRKRIVIDWIRNIGSCEKCGEEKYIYDGFWITNASKHEICSRCEKMTEHIIVAHEVRLLEEIKDLD